MVNLENLKMSSLTEHERDLDMEKWEEKKCKSYNFSKEEAN